MARTASKLPAKGPLSGWHAGDCEIRSRRIVEPVQPKWVQTGSDTWALYDRAGSIVAALEKKRQPEGQAGLYYIRFLTEDMSEHFWTLEAAQQAVEAMADAEPD